MRQPVRRRLYIVYRLMLFAFGTSIVLAGCSGEEDSVRAGVSFSKQIVSILQSHCLECHVPGQEGYETSGLDMSSYDNLMKGTKFGPVVTPGNSVSSTLITLVEGRADPSINMPHGDRPALRPEQIQLLRQWIDEGAMNN